MQSTATTVEAYLNEVPADRLPVITRIRELILQRFTTDVCEEIQSGMLSYCISRELYPNGYHCTPNLDLPFIGLASQKHCVSLYHMGLVANTPLLRWFEQAYLGTGWKLDMGKCCVRFKRMDRVPYEVLEELFSRMDAAAYVEIYRRFDPRNRQVKPARA